MATEEEHIDAVVAFLNTLGAVAHRLGDPPNPLPAKYTEVSVTRRYGGVQRGGGGRDGTLWRIATRQVAVRYQNALNLREKSAGLEEAVITVDGLTTTPIEFESADAIGEDDNFWSGLETWTYAHI